MALPRNGFQSTLGVYYDRLLLREKGEKGGLKEGLELARLFSKSLSPWSLSTLIQNLVGLHCMEKKEGRKGELLSTCLPPK